MKKMIDTNSFDSDLVEALDKYSQTVQARSEFPCIIRHLLLHDFGNKIKLNLPTGKGIGQEGFDGELENFEKHPWIPKGNIYIEIKTGIKAKDGLNQDFNNSLNKLSNIEKRKTSTLVLMTPSYIKNTSSWEKKLNKKGQWGKVIVLSASSIAQWIDQSSIHFRIKELIGLIHKGLKSLEEYCKECVIDFGFNFKKIILTEQEEAVEKLNNWKKCTSSYIEVVSNSIRESILFISAALNNAKDSYILDDEVIAKDLIQEIPNYTLILRFQPSSKLVNNLIKKGHHVCIVKKNTLTAIHNSSIIRLKKRSEKNFAKALIQTFALSEEEAYLRALRTNCQLEIYIRNYPHESENLYREVPSWSNHIDAETLIPILLLGSFNKQNKKDQDIISKLAFSSYIDYEKKLNNFIYYDDSPIQKDKTIYKIKSLQDAWILLNKFISEVQLEKFQEISLEILRKDSGYSCCMQRGIAESFILLNKYLPIRGKNLTHHIVYITLNNRNASCWNTCCCILPLLAEAAPSIFLNTLEEVLNSRQCPILLNSRQCPILYEYYLITALQILSWNPSFLPLTTKCLIKIFEVSNQDLIKNNPLKHLKRIFLLYYPQTMASLSARMKVLDYLINYNKEITFELMISLLTDKNRLIFPLQKPLWETFIPKEISQISKEDYKKSISSISSKIFKIGTTNIKFYKKVIENIEHFPFSIRKKIIHIMPNFLSNKETEKYFSLWKIIGELLYKHYKRYIRSNNYLQSFLLPIEELKKIEIIYEKFSPSDPIFKAILLFPWNDSPKTPEFTKKSLDYDEHKLLLVNKRKACLRKLIKDSGIESIKILIENSLVRPTYIGTIIIDLIEFDVLIQLIKILNLSQDKKNFKLFLDGLFSELFYVRNKISLIKNILKNLIKIITDKKQISDIFLTLPRKVPIWKIIKALDQEISQSYWEQIQPHHFYGHKFGKEEIKYIYKIFYKIDRFIDLIPLIADFSSDFSKKVLLDTLEKIVPNLSQIEYDSELTDHIQIIFDHLNSNSTSCTKRIFALEKFFFNLLNKHTALHKEIIKNPNCFLELLNLFTPSQVDTLMYNYKFLPHINITSNHLRQWLKTAFQLFYNSKLKKLSYFYIGKIIASYLFKKGQLWPDLKIIEVIEEYIDEDLRCSIYSNIKFDLIVLKIIANTQEEKISTLHPKTFLFFKNLEKPNSIKNAVES